MLSPSAQRVQNALREKGFAYDVVELPQTTRSAGEAAAAVGCQVGQIVKSLLFARRESGTPLLVLTSGANRVDEALIGKLLGEPIGRATPEQVREATGFAIGGVPPIGHATPVETLIDEDLLGFEDVWAAAGNPNAVFKLMSADLPKMTSGRTVRVK